MVDPELLKAAELAIGLKVGKTTVTVISVTGEPYITLTNGGIKPEGAPFTVYASFKELAVEQYLASCETYRFNQQKKADGLCVLYWRRHPELLHQESRTYVVTSRMLISDKMPLVDEPSDTVPK